MKGLTEKQQHIVGFIEDFTATMEMTPTIYEIADHFGIKTSTVFAHLRALQKKNILRRSSKARSITLVKPQKKTRMPPGVEMISMLEAENLDSKNELVLDERVFFHAGARLGKRVFAFQLSKKDNILNRFKGGDILLIRTVHPGEIVYGDLLLIIQDGQSIFCRCVDCRNGVYELEPLHEDDQESPPHIFTRLSNPRVKGIVFGAFSMLKS